jgi:capsular exopolysaccharide synthesis family protein
MTLRELLDRLRRYWAVAVVVFAVIMLAGLAAAFLPAERYRSTATLIVQPKADRAVEFGQALAAEFLLPTVVEQLKVESFQREVFSNASRRLGRGSNPDLDVDLKPVNEPGTGIVTIEATSTDRALPQVVANEAASELIARRVSPIIEIVVLDEGRPAESASAPLRLPILFGTAVFGLIAAIVAAIGFGALRNRVDTADTVRDEFGLQVLAEIPAFRRLPLLASELFGSARHRHAVEEYQRLRTVFEIVARGRSAVAVTSWTQGEGKTTVTANLAWAMAAAGRHVLVADCDLRRPQLHEHLGVPLATGVADVGRGGDVDELVQEAGLPTLEVLTSGVPDRHPTELLRAAIPQIADAHEDHLVLIDTPPMFTPETTTVATMIDAVVVVLDGSSRNSTELETLVQDLRLAGADILGVVINRARVKRSRRAAAYYYNPVDQMVSPRRSPQRLGSDGEPGAHAASGPPPHGR